METLIALRGPDLLRVKGFLNVAGCRGPVVVQFVQHLAHPPVELEAWPSADHATRLVFITRESTSRRCATCSMRCARWALHRHPEALGASAQMHQHWYCMRRASKDDRPGPSSFEALCSKRAERTSG